MITFIFTITSLAIMASVLFISVYIANGNKFMNNIIKQLKNNVTKIVTPKDPIQATKNEINNLKTDLQKIVENLSKVKAIVTKTKKSIETEKTSAKDYEEKAKLILKNSKSKNKIISEKEANELATKALIKKNEAETKTTHLQKELKKHEKMENKIQENADKLSDTINEYESTLCTLKARSITASVTKNVNKELARIDSSGTISKLEKIKEKIEEDESLSDVYEEMTGTTDDNEINTVVDEIKKPSEKNILDAFKKKIGLK